MRAEEKTDALEVQAAVSSQHAAFSRCGSAVRSSQLALSIRRFRACRSPAIFSAWVLNANR